MLQDLFALKFPVAAQLRAHLLARVADDSDRDRSAVVDVAPEGNRAVIRFVVVAVVAKLQVPNTNKLNADGRM